MTLKSPRVSRKASTTLSKVLITSAELCAFALFSALSVCAQTPTELLDQADHLANSFNLSKAQPLYRQAETAFRLAGDSRNELNAKFGRLRYSVQLGHYSASRDEIEEILAQPLVEGDPHLKIRALEILGTIDMNQNTTAAFSDWTNLLAAAHEISDAKWANRANGYLGIVSGMNGDVGSAGKALFQALSKAEELDDTVGEVTFAIWLANGMSSNGMGDSGVRLLDRVEKRSLRKMDTP